MPKVKKFYSGVCRICGAKFKEKTLGYFISRGIVPKVDTCRTCKDAQTESDLQSVARNFRL